jgi:hypothetical protein
MQMMGSTGMFELIMMLALPMGGGNDLLDFVPTDKFWQSQGVFVSGKTMISELRATSAEDISSLIEQLSSADFHARERACREILAHGPIVTPQLEAAAKATNGETAMRARSLMRLLGGSQKTSAARRLMAMRTLGELRHRDAIGPLRKLLKSESPFVADFAAQAIARIEGKPVIRRRPTRAELDEDLWILPAKCAAVGQASLLRKVPMSFEKALEKMGPGRRGRAVNKAQVLTKFNALALAAANSLGNMRLDAHTLGVSDDFSQRKGFMVIVVRGQFDRRAVVATLRKQFSGPGAGGFGGMIGVSQINGVDVLSFFGVFKVLLLSDSRMIIIATPSGGFGGAGGGGGMPVKEMIAAAKAGKRPLHENKPLTALVKSIDRDKASLWAAMVPSEHYKKFPLFAPFDSMTLTAVQHEDGSVTGKLVALGADGDARRAAVAMMEQGKAEGTREMEREAARMPVVIPFVAFMKSIETRQDDRSVTVTAKIEDAGPMLMMPLVMMASYGF